MRVFQKLIKTLGVTSKMAQIHSTEAYVKFPFRIIHDGLEDIFETFKAATEKAGVLADCGTRPQIAEYDACGRIVRTFVCDNGIEWIPYHVTDSYTFTVAYDKIENIINEDFAGIQAISWLKSKNLPAGYWSWDSNTKRYGTCEITKTNTTVADVEFHFKVADLKPVEPVKIVLNHEKLCQLLYWCQQAMSQEVVPFTLANGITVEMES